MIIVVYYHFHCYVSFDVQTEHLLKYSFWLMGFRLADTI